MRVIISIPNRESLNLSELITLLENHKEMIHELAEIDLPLVNNSEIPLEE